MTIMGLWHGFTLAFLVYGLYHGVLLVLTDIWLKSETYKKVKNFKFHNKRPSNKVLGGLFSPLLN